MKRILFVFSIFSIMMLTACGAVQQAQLKVAANDVQAEIQQNCSLLTSVSPQEASAWLQSNEEGEKCASGISEPWPKEKIIEISDCLTPVLEQRFKPVSFSKSAFQKYMKDRRKSHEDYAQEKIGWEELTRLSSQRQVNYFTQAMKSGSGSYYNWAQCRNQAFRNHIPSSYPAWADLNNHLAEVSAIARKADKEKMDPADFDVQMQSLWAKYSSQESATLRQAQAANAAAWRDWSQQMQRYSVDMQKAQQQNQSTLKTTNCNFFIGNTMQCIEF